MGKIKDFLAKEIVKIIFWKILLPGGVVLFLSIKQYVLEKKLEVVANPVKHFVNNISKYDIIYEKTFEVLKECNADGIFAGIFVYTDGKGKFVDLHGIWSFTNGFNIIQQSLLEDPSQIKDINLRGMVETLKYIEKSLKNSNTKYSNTNAYLPEFTVNSRPCRLDETTNSIFKQEHNLNKVIDYHESNNYIYQTPFIRCVLDNLQLPQFNQGLKQLYLYPIKITGAEYMFLTLSSASTKDGLCFSKDLKRQELFFEKIEKIVSYQLKI